MRVTINGADSVAAHWTIREPDRGPWTADVRLDGPASEGDEISLAGVWRGTIRHASRDGEFTYCEIYPGADRLHAATRQRFYKGGVAVSSVLSDLCGDVGESREMAPATTLSGWRSRGESLSAELDRLARYVSGGFWRTLPNGNISMVPQSGAAEFERTQTAAMKGWRQYEADRLEGLAEFDLDGWAIQETLFVYSGIGRPTISVWRRPFVAAPSAPETEGATILDQTGGRVDVRTDSGAELAGLPLYSAAGVVPTCLPGARVLVFDLAGDPRATIALAGAFDAVVKRLDLAGEGPPDIMFPGETGRALRYGDTIMMPTGAAATPTPTVIQGPPFPIPASKVRA